MMKIICNRKRSLEIRVKELEAERVSNTKVRAELQEERRDLVRELEEKQEVIRYLKQELEPALNSAQRASAVLSQQGWNR